MALLSLLCNLSYQNHQEVKRWTSSSLQELLRSSKDNDNHMNNHKQMNRADVSSVDRIASCGWRKRKVETLEKKVGQILIGQRWGGEHTHPRAEQRDKAGSAWAL